MEQAQAQPGVRAPAKPISSRSARFPLAGDSLLGLASVLAVLVLWELAVRLLGIKAQVLPTPSAVALALVDYALSGELLLDLLASLRRVAAGMVLGTVGGVLAGFAIALYPRVRAAFYPLIAFLFSMPRVALIPLLIIWFGMDDLYKIVLIALGVFFIMTINTITGVENISRVTLLACRNLGANDRQLLWKVIVPGALPVVFAALRICFSLAMISVIMAEAIVSRDGLGHYIMFAGQLLATDKVFAGLAVAGLLGLVGYRLIDWAERRLMPWRQTGGGLQV